MLVYGSIMGVCTLSTFVFIVFGPGPDGIGVDCNKSYGDTCNVVFRARAAVFAELTWMILISAWEFKSMRRSLFKLNPHSTNPTQFVHDIWENQFLFWSVVIGAVSVFPAVYIPGLNTSVFKHAPITWEWAPAFICVIVFVSGMELWKVVKRSTGWFAEVETEGMKAKRRAGGYALGLRQGFFTLARSFTKTKSEAKSEMDEKNLSRNDSPVGPSRGVLIQHGKETV